MTEQVPPAAGTSGTNEARGTSGTNEARGTSGTNEAPRTAGRPDVLVARDPERAAGLVALLRERGLDPVAAPVIERAPVEDPAELDAARERLADGAYAWVAITSVNAVDALLGPALGGALSDTPGGAPGDTAGSTAGSTPGDTRRAVVGSVRWAAVGPATQHALAERGVAVDLVAAVATSAGLAEAFPAAPGVPALDAGRAPAVGGAPAVGANHVPATGAGHVPAVGADLVPAVGAEGAPAVGADRAPAVSAGPDTAPQVLLPLGNRASGTLRAGLEAKGWAVDVVTVYRTVTRELPPELRRRYDVVVVASGSAARQVAAQLGPQRVVAIGEPSALAAGDVGHTVLAIAETPTDEALARAVTTALAVSANAAPEPGT